MNGKREEKKESSSKGRHKKQEEPHGHRNRKTDANKLTECIRDVTHNVATIGLKSGMQRVSAVIGLRPRAARASLTSFQIVKKYSKMLPNMWQKIIKKWPTTVPKSDQKVTPGSQKNKVQQNGAKNVTFCGPPAPQSDRFWGVVFVFCLHVFCMLFEKVFWSPRVTFWLILGSPLGSFLHILGVFWPSGAILENSVFV